MHLKYTSILFNKPFQVMSQFSPSGEKRTLKDFIDIPNIYPAGRLDFDSEGLLLLTDDSKLQHELSDPKFKLEKTYFAQVEGEIDEIAIHKLRNGVTIQKKLTLPAAAQKID